MIRKAVGLAACPRLSLLDRPARALTRGNIDAATPQSLLLAELSRGFRVVGDTGIEPGTSAV